MQRQSGWLISIFCFLSFTTLAFPATTVKIINVDAADIIYDPFSNRIYAAATSTDLNYANCLVTIDPVTGNVEGSIFAGSNPSKLTVSKDGKYVYIGLDGSGRISRFNISSKTIDQDFSLGTGSYGTTYAEDIAVQPGNSNVIAVSRYRKGVSPRHDGVAIYDNGIKRPQQTADHTGANRIEWSDSPEFIYGYNNETTEYGLRTLLVNEYGVSTISTKQGLIQGFYQDIEYAGGFLYSTQGNVVNCDLMQLAGQFAASGMVEPDSTVRRTFFINGSTISAYDQSTFVKTGQYTISGTSGSPRNLIRWAKYGLAYSNTSGQIVIVETDLVPEPPELTSLAIEGPEHLSSYKGQYKLIANVSDGVVLDVTNKSKWQTEPNTYTSMDSQGVLYIFGTDQNGTTTIKADFVWAGNLYNASKDVTYDGIIPARGNLTGLEIISPRQVIQETSVQIKATALFDDGTQYDVTNKVIWEISDTEFADIEGAGLLKIGKIERSRDLIIYASFGYRTVELKTVKTIIILEDSSQMTNSDWPMYQANPQHTGYVPISLDPEDFSLKWEKQIGNGKPLNPVTAANGKVFVSLHVRFDDITSFFATDARDGEILWSKGFGRVNSVNPPSFAYGNVYIQTGNHSGDTYLHAFEADTGNYIFKSPHSAQWERYYAPTVYDGSVYINGGYYGGMYGFNAFTGVQQWFRSLSQYDEWTPAVEGDYSYGYVGGLLSAVNRFYGTVDFTISDPGFQWHGWSMDLVPVIGSMNDILVINSSRLINFDLINKKKGWEIGGNFSGQPSIAKNVIYAINNGSLEARNESDGNLLWSWSPPEGQLTDTLIATDTHIIARTSNNTYAIDLSSKQQVWSYPASGHLALGNDILYLARNDGILTAIAMPSSQSQPVACIVNEQKYIEAQGPFGAKVTLDGSCSKDDDSTPGTNDDISEFDWYIALPKDSNETYIGSGQTIECNLPLGEYIIILEVTDKQGQTNSTETTIIVQDTTPPSVNCPDEIVLEATSPQGAIATFDVQASDIVDPSPREEYSVPPGSMFPLGLTKVLCTVTDESGNQSNCYIYITVCDRTPPILNCPADITVEATSPQGAIATFSFNAIDIADPSPITSCKPESGSMFRMGTTQVTCTATDSSGNTATCFFKINVVDTAAPEFELSVSPTTLWPANHKMVKITPTCVVTDLCDPSPQVSFVDITVNESCNPNDIKMSGDGSIYLCATRSGDSKGRIYTLTYEACDNSGNCTTRTATVTVPHDMRK